MSDSSSSTVVLDLDVEMKAHPDFDSDMPHLVYARPDAYAWADARVQQRFNESLQNPSLRTIILDGTGTKVERTLRRAAQAKHAGWTTKLLHVHVTLATALRRNARRSRQVPKGVLEGYQTELSAAVAAVSKDIDKMLVIDNNAEDGLTGRERWGQCWERYDADLSGSAHLVAGTPPERDRG